MHMYVSTAPGRRLHPGRAISRFKLAFLGKDKLVHKRVAREGHRVLAVVGIYNKTNL